MRPSRDLLFFGVVLGGGYLLWTLMFPTVKLPAPTAPPPDETLVDRVQQLFVADWNAAGLQPAGRATDLQIARRIALGLMGTVPSLEELRELERQPEATRLQWYLEYVLADPRCHAHLAERLLRASVGVEEGPYVFYRRNRLTTWLRDQLAQNEPYDRIVRHLLADEGLWTAQPSTNFLTVTVGNDPQALEADNLTGRITRYTHGLGLVATPLVNTERLAGRVTRAFLGVRLDCAQCHDHPFATWTQADFQGLAAFFAETKVDHRGVHDQATPTTKAPRVPFQPELLPTTGSRRQQLATWVTHPENTYFARAAVNRLWAVLFGRGLQDPVDDLHTDHPFAAVLETLARDFAQHYDIRRLLRVLVALPVFAMASTDENASETAEEHWALFPLTRLRAEQIAGSIVQATSVTTLSTTTHWLLRQRAQQRQTQFRTHYGDLGENEFDDRCGTIAQRLLVMNSPLVQRHLRPSFWNASTRIAHFAAPAQAIEAVYLCVLTRRPTPAESAHFVQQFTATPGTREQHTEDLFWTLLNTTEAAWNH